MQRFEFLRQPLMGELAMSWKKEREKEREKNAICSLCQQPRAAHALRSDQEFIQISSLQNGNSKEHEEMTISNSITKKLELFATQTGQKLQNLKEYKFLTKGNIETLKHHALQCI